MKRREGYHLPESCLYSKNKREKIEFREKLLFLPFVKYNTVSDSPLFLKMYEENFLRDSSSHFFDI